MTSAAWSQDVMGAVYERFLAHKLLQDGGRIVIEDTDEMRKREGIVYTPEYIGDYIVAHTLGEKVKPILAEAIALLATGSTLLLTPKSGNSSTSRCSIRRWVPAPSCSALSMRWSGAYGEYNEPAAALKRIVATARGCCFDAPADIAERSGRRPADVLTEKHLGVDLDAQGCWRWPKKRPFPRPLLPLTWAPFHFFGI